MSSRSGPLPPPALLLVAHGSRDATVGCVINRLTERVRALVPDAAVVPAYLELAEPSVTDALDRLVGSGHRRVVVVPLLLAAAYHARTDLPQVLRSAAAARPAVTITTTAVLGPHPLLVTAVDRRLDEPGRRPRRTTGVVLVAAGSRDTEATARHRQTAAALQRRGWGRVLAAYLSHAAPSPATAIAQLYDDGYRDVVAASYLLTPGWFHSRLASIAADRGASVTAPLADTTEVARLVRVRYDQYDQQRASVADLA